jgi:hypothetical protein
MAIPTTYRGANAAIASLKKLAEFSPDEFARALFEEAKVEVKEMQRIAPKESGDMAGEITADDPVRRGRQISVTIHTGPKSIDYALIQHEDLDLDHPNGGEAKFIEKPLKESAPYLPTRLAKRIDLNRYKK